MVIDKDPRRLGLSHGFDLQSNVQIPAHNFISPSMGAADRAKAP